MTAQPIGPFGANMACNVYLHFLGYSAPKTCSACGQGPCTNVPSQTRDDVQPDPATTGWWWMRHATGRVEPWEWNPGPYVIGPEWRRGDRWVYSAVAYAQGWRVVGPAVPPGDTVSPDHLAQRMADITSAEGLKTMTQSNAFVARMVGK